ncbi:MAG TPA: enoyl-CoA hydratase/isomerase family protein [Acidimicrobiales bacterium]|nr:enoyl-CoA hydratase/isomerase family protein [Acidimicrobiales bacterium]
MGEHIRYQVDGRVAMVTIDRPERRNAMSYAVLADFHEALGRAAADDAVRAVVVTGAGGAFCAGTDLTDLSDTPTDQRGARAGDAPPRAWAMQRIPKPVVAAVDGWAVGMGAEFATQCDVRVASTTARFAWNFGHRGLVPDTGAASWLLPRQVGMARALRLVLSGDPLDAAEALAIGFVAAVVEQADLLGAAVEEAARLSKGSPFAARLAKELLYAGYERNIAAHLAATREALTACFASDDHKEGVAAFLERREANFVGR